MNCQERGYNLRVHAFVAKYPAEKDVQRKYHLDEKFKATNNIHLRIVSMVVGL